MLALLLLLAQPVDCTAGSPVLLRDETAQACARGEVAVLYLRGLIAARDASALGGSAQSLEPVQAAIAGLERVASADAQARIAAYVLRAAAAAAQGERDEMALFLTQALQAETVQIAARQTGAPVVSAHEVAGDLWLRLHLYHEARQAFLDAFKQLGPTPRVLLGLARAEARLKGGPGACPDSQISCP
jgi:hypothetical protein